MNASVLSNHFTVVIIADTRRLQTFVIDELEAQPPALHPGEQRVSCGEVASVERTHQHLHIMSGYAWLTLDGQDLLLEAGQQVELQPGGDRALISALGDEPLVYRLYPAS